MKLHVQSDRLAFYRVIAKVFGQEKAWLVAAEDFYSAQSLVKQKYSIFKRPFLTTRWFYDNDPIPLTDSGYLQKLSNMHIVQDIEAILEAERA
jgi:hypothetical protein